MIIPPAYKLTIMSSTSVKCLEPLGTIVGRNVPALSLDMSMVTGPSWLKGQKGHADEILEDFPYD
ncbi:hypothetical protein BHF98_11565 [Corynebacterium diphtheriae]|nr:hypothetical protein BHF98_11565 [Corynebacterium diphtheriae]